MNIWPDGGKRKDQEVNKNSKMLDLYLYQLLFDCARAECQSCDISFKYTLQKNVKDIIGLNIFSSPIKRGFVPYKQKNTQHEVLNMHFADF